MIKRSILAVTRRKTKSIIFLVFLFVVASLVLCSISIKNTTNKSMENVKTTFFLNKLHKVIIYVTIIIRGGV